MNKQAARNELDAQTAAFFASGGRIQHAKMGEGARIGRFGWRVLESGENTPDHYSEKTKVKLAAVRRK